jgi:hypothetical protein
MLRRIFEALRKRVDVAIALLVLIEGTQFVLSYLAPWVPIVGPLLARNYNFIIGVVAGLSLTGLILLLPFLRIEMARRRSLERDMRRIQADNQTLHTFLAHFDECAPVYRTLARNNAICDWKLFNLLYCEYHAIPEQYPALAAAAVAVINGNIQQVLDTAKRVYTVHTGFECEACLQMVDHLEGTRIEDAVIRTAMRDSFSERPMSTGKHYVRDNSYHRKIFLDRASAIVENDLHAAQLRGEFTTTSNEWTGRYNAVLIIPIENVAPYAMNGATRQTASLPKATLCIDNKKGGFEGELPLHIARELAWRLGVLVWRAVTLDRDLADAEKRKSGHG